MAEETDSKFKKFMKKIWKPVVVTGASTGLVLGAMYAGDRLDAKQRAKNAYNGTLAAIDNAKAYIVDITTTSPEERAENVINKYAKEPDKLILIYRTIGDSLPEKQAGSIALERVKGMNSYERTEGLKQITDTLDQSERLIAAKYNRSGMTSETQTTNLGVLYLTLSPENQEEAIHKALKGRKDGTRICGEYVGNKILDGLRSLEKRLKNMKGNDIDKSVDNSGFVHKSMKLLIGVSFYPPRFS